VGCVSRQNSLPQNLSNSNAFAGSLAETAQRDLDAALQLLADRAQFITGASGAAIALRRDGRNDMLCRASTGSNAPELGALLSTEFGLSGESVRTRRPLRCDDAERDARVNREVCRKLGIASVVVMPVVNDDGVLGVFELFSRKVNAFGERDLSAVQRLSEMVETAVRLAHVTVSLPEALMPPPPEMASPAVQASVHEDDAEEILDEEIFADAPKDQVLPATPTDQAAIHPAAAVEAKVTSSAQAVRAEIAPVQKAAAAAAAQPASPSPAIPAKKLFWSLSVTPAADAEKPAAPDQSHVPPVLRGLRKCEVCGFPVTAGRVLCVECEEKKWRGQLRRPPTPLR